MGKELDRESREILEEKLERKRDKPLSQGVNKGITPESSRIDIEAKSTRVEKVINQYNNIITLADEIAAIIEKRSKDVEVSFNPDENITLRDSIRRVFGIDTDIVTYKMYKKCLELREQLAEEDRETLRSK